MFNFWNRLYYRRLRRLPSEALMPELLTRRWRDILNGGTQAQQPVLAARLTDLPPEAQMEAMRVWTRRDEDLVRLALDAAERAPERIDGRAILFALQVEDKSLRKKVSSWAREHCSITDWEFALKLPGTEARYYMAVALARNPEALPLLRELLDDEKAQVQIAAVRSLATLGGPEAGSALCEFLLTMEGRWRILNERVEEEIHKADRISLVKLGAIFIQNMMLDSEEPLALRTAKSKRAALLPLVTATLEALKSYPCSETYATLLQFGAQRVPGAPQQAAQALASFGNSVSPYVRATLSAQHEAGRYTAALTLGLIGGVENDAALTPMLRDESSAVRMLAVLALRQRSIELDFEGVYQSLEMSHRNLRRHIYEILIEQPDTRFWSALTRNHKAGEQDERHIIEKVISTLVEMQEAAGLKSEHVTACYCTACRARAVVESYNRWNGLRCRLCHDSRHLQGFVRRVVGYIGPPPAAAPAGELHLSLWDEAAHKATRADVDEIVIAGGAAVSYDWAVNAVLQTLTDAGHAGAPVRVEGAAPLSENTRRLLAEWNV